MATTTFVSIAVTIFCIYISGIAARDIPKESILKQRNPDDSCPRTTEQKLLSHESDCTLFYICLNGRAVLHKCPNGLHFSVRTSVCDFPRNAGCETELPRTTRPPKGKIGGDFFITCPSSHNGRDTSILVSHPLDCGMYYMCDNGVAHLKSCQPGLHFNPSLRACDYPEAAGCETTVTKSPRDQVVSGKYDLECPAKNGVLPVLMKHETDCSKFYICDNGKPHPKDCQAGLYFNPKINACDYPANVVCDSDGNSKDGRNKKGKLQDDFLNGCPSVQTEETILVADPSDCSKFFMCHRGQPHPRVCPSGLHFNRFSQECDYPDKAQCQALGLMLATGVESPFCPTVSGKIPIFFGHPSNCSIYYLCSNGLAYEFVCPARLHFNLRQKVCDYESAARCPAGKKSDP